MDLAGLISGAMGTSEQCSSEVYVSGDNELATCVEFDDDTWDQRFLKSLGVQNDMKIKTRALKRLISYHHLKK